MIKPFWTALNLAYDYVEPITTNLGLGTHARYVYFESSNGRILTSRNQAQIRTGGTEKRHTHDLPYVKSSNVKIRCSKKFNKVDQEGIIHSSFCEGVICIT